MGGTNTSLQIDVMRMCASPTAVAVLRNQLRGLPICFTDGHRPEEILVDSGAMTAGQTEMKRLGVNLVRLLDALRDKR